MPLDDGSPAEPLIYSIVLNFNNTIDTDECIESLTRQDYSNHVIILADNGSVDNSLSTLRDKWGSQIEILANGENLGVAGGYNAGIRVALEAGAAYVVVCNNDIAVEPDFITSLVQMFISNPNTGAAAPVMAYYDRPELIWFGKVYQHPLLAYSVDRLRNQPVASVEPGEAVFETDWLPTCATMFSSDALRTIGLLDERLFFGHDDVDVCMRLRQRGLACRVVPRVLVRHKVSVTSGVRGSTTMSPRTTYLDAKGSILVGAKHFRGRRALPFFFGFFFIRMPFKLQAIVVGRQWRNLRAYISGITSGLVSYGPDFIRNGR